MAKLSALIGAGGGANPMLPVGSWDMTGTMAPAVPVLLQDTTATPPVSGENWTFTFPLVASPLGMASSAPLTLAGGTGSASFVVPALDPGDNAIALGAFLTNAGATRDDIASSVVDLPNLHGSVTQLVMCVLIPPFGLTLYHVTGSGMDSTAPVAAIAGDVVSLTLDADAGSVAFQINAGAPVSLAATVAGSFRVSIGAFFGSVPPQFAAGSLVGTLATSAGGRTPFRVVADAAPPPGAVDGTRWNVIAPGAYRGYATRQYDTVEFRNALQDLIITRLPLSDAEILVLVQAVVGDTLAAAADPVADALAAGSIYGVTDGSGALVTTRVYWVAPGSSGPLDGFAAGSLAAWNGTEWVEVARSQIIGRSFEFVALNYTQADVSYQVRMRCAYVGSPASGTDRPYLSRAGSLVLGSGVTEQTARQYGWVLEAPAGSNALWIRTLDASGQSASAIEVESAEFVELVIDQNLTFTVNAGVGVPFPVCSQLLRVRNSGLSAATLTFSGPGGAHLIAAGDFQLFRLTYDSSGGLGFVEKLTMSI